MIDGRTGDLDAVRKLPLPSGRPVWAIGVMTGTSMDGVDAALVLTDGETIARFGPSAAVGFMFTERSEIEAAIAEVAAALDQPCELTWMLHMPEDGELFPRLEGNLVLDYREACLALARTHFNSETQTVRLLLELDEAEVPPEAEVSVIGIHGQTIGHRPEEGFTLQLGSTTLDGAALAHSLGTTVVCDFRRADIAESGQGAPLAPFFHHALARMIEAQAPLAFLNLGGVGNVTWIDPSRERPEEPGAVLAFDTGPANALIDDWMKRCTGILEMDVDGAAASTGRVHRDRLASNSAWAYLNRRPPKSLDRNDFHGVLAAMEGLSINDGAATLTAFTVDCVAESLKHMPAPPSRWLVCGGGRLNRTMMGMLAGRLGAPVEPVEAVGLDGDMLEAQAFAYLAVRVLRGLPTSAPSTTGCREPVCGGRISVPG